VSGASRGSILILILALAAVDAGVLAALGESPEPGPLAGAPEDWALCQTELEGRPVTPATVAITYLDGGDAGLAPATLRGWFGDLDPVAVDVYRLEDARGVRRLSFELARGKWPVWGHVVKGARGGEICDRVRAALLERRIGRPVPPGTEPDARHAYEFIYARRPHLYRTVAWVGTLAHLLEDDTLDTGMRWLAGETP
jgi:hypothetical protein